MDRRSSKEAGLQGTGKAIVQTFIRRLQLLGLVGIAFLWNLFGLPGLFKSPYYGALLSFMAISLACLWIMEIAGLFGEAATNGKEEVQSRLTPFVNAIIIALIIFFILLRPYTN